MADEKKCEHPSCACRAKEGGDYCGTLCESAGSAPDINCNCGHPECSPKTSRL